MEETPCICVTFFQLKHEALLVLGPCECSSYLCCWCAIFELFANLTSRFILVSLVGTRLAHLRHMELVPTLPLSFTSHVQRLAMFDYLDGIHLHALEGSKDLLLRVDLCMNWGVSTVLLPELHSSHFMGSIIPLMM